MSLRYRRVMSSYKKGGSINQWWLAGEIDPSYVVAAYQPKGAASYAASKINLANPGTYDAEEGTAPDWDAVNGWQFDKTNSEYLIVSDYVTPDKTYTMVAKTYQSAKSNGAILCAGAQFYYGLGDMFFENREPDIYGLFDGVVWLRTNTPDAKTGEHVYLVSAGATAAQTYFYYDGDNYPHDQQSSGTAQPQPTSEFKINGKSGNFMNINVHAAAFYSVQITTDQIAALTTAMNAL